MTTKIILEQNGWNSASQVQQGDRNYSRVRQDGGDNRVQTNQLNLDNWTEVVQNGSSNQASVIQIGDIYSGHSASIVQLGTDNLAEVSQMEWQWRTGEHSPKRERANVHRVTQLYYMNEADSRSVGTNNLTEISQEWAGSARTDQLGNDTGSRSSRVSCLMADWSRCIRTAARMKRRSTSKAGATTSARSS